MYAFLDANNNVIGVSLSDVSLAQAQIKNPEITQRIEGAPDTLFPRYLSVENNYTYHKKTSGEGTHTDDYTLIDDLEALRVYKYAQFCSNTEVLYSLGFVYPAQDGKIYPLHDFSIRDIHATMICSLTPELSDLVDFPVKRRTINNEIVEFNNLESILPWWHAALERERYIKKGQRDLLESLNVAVTRQQLDAVVETRS